MSKCHIVGNNMPRLNNIIHRCRDSNLVLDGSDGMGKVADLWRRDIGCVGRKRVLQECQSLNSGVTSGCYHDMDVAIACKVDKYNDGTV